MSRKDREQDRGGGELALYVHNSLEVKERSDLHVNGAEDIYIEIINKKRKKNHCSRGFIIALPVTKLNYFITF